MLEYTGIGIIVAATLVVIGSANGLDVLPGGLQTAVCNVLGGDCASTKTGKGERPEDPNEKFKPDECETKTTGEKHGGTVSLGIVELGKEWELKKTKVQKADGTTAYKVTMTSGGKAGVNGGAGFNIGKVGTEVEVGADAKFGYGDTWEFKSKAEMDKFSDGLHQAWLDNIQSGSTPGYEMGMAMRDDEPLPDPTSTISKGGVEGTVGGTFTPPGDGKGAEHSGTVEFTPSGERTTTRNAKDGTTQTTEQFKLEGKGGGSSEWEGGNNPDRTGTLDYGAVGSSSGAMSIKRDKNGKIVEVEFVQTVEVGADGSGEFEGAGGPKPGADGKERNGRRSGGIEGGETVKGVAVVTRKLAVDNEQERAAVNRWLSANNDFGTVAKTMGDSALAAIRGSESEPGPGASDFERLMYNKGKTTRAMYKNHTEAFEVAARIKAGWSFGASFSSERSTETITDGEYLGAPNANGERTYVNFPECERR
ncbi:MAG: hypothetical protein GEV11_20225 [Streptosporangiales bacterium]|nr:hypothetical protein [Streptosporangiales bacterium]